jgi:hypothetical protein
MSTLPPIHKMPEAVSEARESYKRARAVLDAATKGYRSEAAKVEAMQSRRAELAAELAEAEAVETRERDGARSAFRTWLTGGGRKPDTAAEREAAAMVRAQRLGDALALADEEIVAAQRALVPAARELAQSHRGALRALARLRALDFMADAAKRLPAVIATLDAAGTPYSEGPIPESLRLWARGAEAEADLEGMTRECDLGPFGSLAEAEDIDRAAIAERRAAERLQEPKPAQILGTYEGPDDNATHDPEPENAGELPHAVRVIGGFGP